MKRSAYKYVCIGLFVVTVTLVMMSCISKDESPAEAINGGILMVNSCVTCHSDQALLKDTAAPTQEVEIVEDSGEG